MKFCSKCGSIMFPRTDRSKVKMVCGRCGAFEKSETESVVREKGTEVNDVEIVDSKDDVASYPETDAECPKCGHDKAYYWLVQTRAADEAETRFFRCTKCGHTWREYD